jgi:DNA repair protein RecN (Recombination protein N)
MVYSLSTLKKLGDGFYKVLTTLAITNIVLIDKLTLEFKDGFCALTGETGAGKSILLDSLSLALGARADQKLVKAGKEQACVSACFELPPKHPVYLLLANQGIEVDETLILKRVLQADGKSKAYINDQPVSVALLKECGDLLVEIHGQFEAQGLLDPKTHLSLLDEFAGIQTEILSKLWEGWKEAEKTLAQEVEKLEALRAREDYLRSSLEDLDELAPEAGEFSALSMSKERLQKREQILSTLNNAFHSLGEAETIIGKVWRDVEKLGEVAEPLVSGICTTHAELQEVISAIEDTCSDVEHSEMSLEQVEDRIYALQGQARKHGCEIDELSVVREEIARELAEIDKKDVILSDLHAKVSQTKKDFLSFASDCHERRARAASSLDKKVAEELSPLKLEKARFVTKIEQIEESAWGASGIDRVRFLVATNPGAEPGPLNKIASGGELARFTLALKVVLGSRKSSQSLVFDEVDSGIGGAVAAAVGDRLRKLSRQAQILVVTHSPQVAARADHHWIVLKQGDTELKTTVLSLDELYERREEIARMISGESISEEARAAADKLLERTA